MSLPIPAPFPRLNMDVVDRHIQLLDIDALVKSTLESFTLIDTWFVSRGHSHSNPIMGRIYKEVQNYNKAIDTTLRESHSGSVCAEKIATDLESVLNQVAPHRHAKSHGGMKDVAYRVESALKGAGKMKAQFSNVRTDIFEVTEQVKKTTTSAMPTHGDEDSNGLIVHLEQLAVYVSTFYNWWTDIENRLQFIRALVDKMETNTINRPVMQSRLAEIKSSYSEYNDKIGAVVKSRTSHHDHAHSPIGFLKHLRPKIHSVESSEALY